MALQHLTTEIQSQGRGLEKASSGSSTRAKDPGVAKDQEAQQKPEHPSVHALTQSFPQQVFIRLFLSMSGIVQNPRI